MSFLWLSITITTDLEKEGGKELNIKLEDHYKSNIKDLCMQNVPKGI